MTVTIGYHEISPALTALDWTDADQRALRTDWNVLADAEFAEVRRDAMWLTQKSHVTPTARQTRAWIKRFRTANVDEAGFLKPMYNWQPGIIGWIRGVSVLLADDTSARPDYMHESAWQWGKDQHRHCPRSAVPNEFMDRGGWLLTDAFTDAAGGDHDLGLTVSTYGLSYADLKAMHAAGTLTVRHLDFLRALTG